MTETKVKPCEAEVKKVWQMPKLSLGITGYDIFAKGIGFFLAMAVPLPGMAPFGLAFLAQERKFSVKAVMAFIAAGLGSIVACDRLGAAKYIGAGLIYLAALFVLERGVRVTDVTAGLVAGAGVFVTGLSVIFVRGFSVTEFLLLLCEVSIVVAASLMMEKSSEFMQKQRFSALEIDSETKLSLGAVMAIAILSLKQIYIGSDFSVMNCAAAALLLIVAAGCGATYSTGAGVILGLVCGIGGDYFMPVLGAFSFCGFLAGVFSKFGKGGVVSGIIIANAVMVIYTNSAMQAVLSLFEVLASAIVFVFVPDSYIEAVKEIIFIGENDRKNISRMKEGLRARLAAVAAAFENMSKTLDRLSEKNGYDTGDITAVFDVTADKVCRKCRKSPICWGKDFNSTYREMFEMLNILREVGKLDENGAREHFAGKCLNLTALINELSHQFEIYRVRETCRNKLSENRDIVGQQLSGMSKILDGLADELCFETRPASVSAWEVRSRLERRGIKAKDLNVFRDKNGRHKIEVVMKGGVIKDKHKTHIEKIMKSILKCPVMNTEEEVLGRKYIKLCFSEAERYKVETLHASCAAEKTNGDNFRMLHLSEGKYVVAISDGMGTGDRAAKESEAILELLDSFLQAGFDSRTAMRMINSIMIMKSGDEAIATVDLCIIDLFTGEVKFIKTGAEPSFIMQKDGGVETVCAASLPMGIVTDAEADVSKRRIMEGDRIVMITDGVESRENGSLWVSDFIHENCRGDNEGDIAREILNQAIVKNSGTVNDDMTVLSLELKAVC